MASLPLIATLIKVSTVPCGLFLIILLLNSPSCTEAENILYPGEILRSGDSLTYGSTYRFTMRSDCNLVLYEGTTPVWATNTSGRGQNCRCTVQNDGNLDVFSSNGSRVWSSGSPGDHSGKYVLVLQRDRNVVIYGPFVWATRTSKDQTAQVVATETKNILYARGTLHSGDSLTYGSRYRFIMKSDCDLVLYEGTTTVWATNTSGRGQNCFCTLQNDGNLDVFSSNGSRVWGTGLPSWYRGNNVLILQRDRNVVIYGPSVWATGTKKALIAQVVAA